MIPGTTTKLSEGGVPFATIISAKSDILMVTGAGTIQTILPNFGAGFSGVLVLVPLTAALILGTGGNILVGGTTAINRPVWLIYIKSLNKWMISGSVT